MASATVAFTALARSVARQSSDEVLQFPPDRVGPDGESQSEEILEFPPDHVGPDGQSPDESLPDEFGPDTDGGQSDEILEFPPDRVGPEYSE